MNTSANDPDLQVLLEAGFALYEARQALATAPDGVFCHAYFYSDGKWRFQTGGQDIRVALPSGVTTVRCLLTKPLYSAPTTEI